MRTSFSKRVIVVTYLALPTALLADNCGGLTDCYGTIRAALAATVAVGIFAAILSAALDFTPVLGQIKGVMQAITGKEWFTGRELKTWERALGIIPVAGVALEEGLAIARAVREGELVVEAAREGVTLANAERGALDLTQSARELESVTLSHFETEAHGGMDAAEGVALSEQRIELAAELPSDFNDQPVFTSYHDERLPEELIGPEVSDDVQFREATKALKQYLRENPESWDNFTPTQQEALREAFGDMAKPGVTNGRIDGFTWHHHDMDEGVLQLVDRPEHRIYGHYGGRAAGGGRR